MSAATFLQTSRHDSIYYFRRRVPADLQTTLRRVQFTISLHTADRRTAIVRARALAVQTDSLFSRMRKRPVDAEDDFLMSGFTMEFRLDEDGTGQVVTVSSDPGDAADGERALEALRIVRGGAGTATALARAGGPSQPLAEAVAAYLSASGVKAATARSYKTQLAELVGHFGPTFNVFAIDQSLFVKYADAVKAHKMRSPKTKGDYIGAAGTFLNQWRERAPDLTPIKVNRQKPRDDSPNEPKRSLFSLQEVQVLFESAAAHRASQPERFWSTVALAFLGARVEEIAQLNVTTDLVSDDDGLTWHLRLLEEKDADGTLRKSIKTRAGHRLVPIPSVLVKYGFVTFLQAAMLNPSKRPFEAHWKPYVHKQTGDVKWSQYMVKWGSRELQRMREAGLLAAVKCTYSHSWRHTFSTELQHSGVSIETRSAIMGHGVDGENSRYTHSRMRPEELRQHLEGGVKRLEAILDRVMVDFPGSPASP